METELSNFINSNKPKAFNVKPIFNELDNSWSCFFENSNHYAENLTNEVIVYRDVVNEHIVGVKLLIKRSEVK